MKGEEERRAAKKRNETVKTKREGKIMREREREWEKKDKGEGERYLLVGIGHLLELLDNSRHRLGTMLLVITSTDSNGVALLFLLSNNKNVVVLFELGVTNLLVQLVAAIIDINVEAGGVDLITHLASIVEEQGTDRNDLDLTRRDPERPLSSAMLSEDSNLTLNGTENGAVHNNGSIELVLFLSLVLEVESDGQLEIKLDGSTLVTSVEGISEFDIDLGTVKGSITRVQLPSATELIETAGKGTLGIVPDLDVSEVLLGTGGELQVEGVAKDTIHVLQEVETPTNLILNLRGTAEDVSIILLETTDTGESSEGTRELVAVEHSEIGPANGKVTVRAVGASEHDTVAGTVHGLESELGLLHLEDEHVLLVVLVVTRGLPEINVEHVGGHNLLETTLLVLSTDERDESVVDAGSVGEEEARSGGDLVEEPQLLVLSDLSVVSLLGLLEPLHVLLQLLVVGERDTVDTLQRGVIGVSKPVGGRVFGDAHSLDLVTVGDMRSSTEIDKGSRTVGKTSLSIRNLVLDDLLLERVVFEQLKGLLLLERKALKGNLVTNHLLHRLLESGKVLVGDGAVTHLDIIVETTLINRGSNTQVTSILQLHGESEKMRGRMPESVLSFGGIESTELQLTSKLERTHEIPVSSVGLSLDPSDHQLLGKTLGDTKSDIHGGSFVGVSLLDGTVGKSDFNLDFITLLLGAHLLELLEQLDTVLNILRLGDLGDDHTSLALLALFLAAFLRLLLLLLLLAILGGGSGAFSGHRLVVFTRHCVF